VIRTRLPFAAICARQLSICVQSALPLRRFGPAGVHRPLQGRAGAVEVHRQLARLHIKRHKVTVDIHAAQLHLAEQLRALHVAAQAQTGVELPSAFSPRAKIGLIIASEKLLILTLPPRLRRPCGSVTCTCPSS
jgi:hypothetical protein